METVKIIKTYEAKTGEVTITEYVDDKHTIYFVKHSNPILPGGEWCYDRAHAIMAAQFLSRY